MGFLNPWLYATASNYPRSFNDVTAGNNACGRAIGLMSTMLYCDQGFAATSGWVSRYETACKLTLICFRMQ